MNLKSELQKQCTLGTLTLILAILGASSVFVWLSNLLSKDIIVGIMFIIMCMTSIITVITKHQDAVLVESLQKERLRAKNLKSAYIFAHAAYQKAIGMTTRDFQYNGNLNVANEGSAEHLRSMSHNAMYMESERFAREVGEEI